MRDTTHREGAMMITWHCGVGGAVMPAAGVKQDIGRRCWSLIAAVGAVSARCSNPPQSHGHAFKTRTDGLVTWVVDGWMSILHGDDGHAWNKCKGCMR